MSDQLRHYIKAYETSVYAAAVSDATGRTFRHIEPILTQSEEDMETAASLSSNPAGEIGAEAAKRRARKALDKFKESDAAILRVFDVKLKGLAVELEDMRGFSDSDTQNLMEQLDDAKMTALCLASGAFDKTKDKDISKVLETGFNGGANYQAVKKFLIAFTEAFPTLNLAMFIDQSESDRTGHKKARLTTYKLKDEASDLLVDAKGADAVLTDGTIVGNGLRSQKVWAFLKKQGTILETSQDMAILLKSRRIVEKLKHLYPERKDIPGIEGAYLRNPLLRGASYNKSRDAINGAVTQAYTDELARDTTDARKEILAGLLGSCVFEEPYNSDPFWEKTDAELLKSARAIVKAYTTALEPFGGHTYAGKVITEALEAEGERLAKLGVEVSKVMRGMKEEVLGALKAEGKPATERRVNAKVDEWFMESMPDNSWLTSQWSLRRLFSDDIAKAEAEEKGVQAVKDAARAEKATKRTKPAKVSVGRIKSAGTAAQTLVKRYADLSPEDWATLMEVAMGEDANRSYKAEGVARTILAAGIFADEGFRRLCAERSGDILLKNFHKLNSMVLAKARLEIEMHALGNFPDDGWETLSPYTAITLRDKVPEAYLPAALREISELRAQDDDKQVAMFGTSTSDALMRLIERLPAGAIVGEDAGAVLNAFRRLLEAGRGEFAVKHLERLGAKESGHDAIEMLMVAASLAGEDPAKYVDTKPLDGRKDSALLFAHYFSVGNHQEAARWLTLLLRSGKVDDDREDNYVDRRLKDFSRSPSSLLAHDLIRRRQDDDDDKIDEDTKKGADGSRSRVTSLQSYCDFEMSRVLGNMEIVSNDAYAPILLKFLRETVGHSAAWTKTESNFHHYQRSSESGKKPQRLLVVESLLKAAGEDKSSWGKTVEGLFGPSSSESLFFFASEGGELNEDAIVKDLLSKAQAKSSTVYYYYGNSQYNLQEDHLKFFEKLVKADRAFANEHNLGMIGAREHIRKSLSEDTVYSCASAAVSAIQSGRSYSSALRSAGRILEFFKDSKEASSKIILSVDNLTPKIAVALASHLHPAAVAACASRLFAVAKKSKETLDDIRQYLPAESLDDADAKRLASTPMALAERVLSGDKSLSEAEWGKVFSDASSRTALVGGALDNEDVKLIKQMNALATTYDMPLEDEVKSGFVRKANYFCKNPESEVLPLILSLCATDSEKNNLADQIRDELAHSGWRSYNAEDDDIESDTPFGELEKSLAASKAKIKFVAIFSKDQAKAMASDKLEEIIAKIWDASLSEDEDIAKVIPADVADGIQNYVKAYGLKSLLPEALVERFEQRKRYWSQSSMSGNSDNGGALISLAKALSIEIPAAILTKAKEMHSKFLEAHMEVGA